MKDYAKNDGRILERNDVPNLRGFPRKLQAVAAKGASSR